MGILLGWTTCSGSFENHPCALLLCSELCGVALNEPAPRVEHPPYLQLPSLWYPGETVWLPCPAMLEVMDRYVKSM